MGPYGVPRGRYGGIESHGRSQRGLGGPARGLSTAAGPMLQECALMASQGLSGALNSEQGRSRIKNPPTP